MYKDLPEFKFDQITGSADAVCRVVLPKYLKCTEGYFPDEPVVPGALLMGWVWAAAKQNGWQCRSSITGAEFSQPVTPGDQIRFYFYSKADSLQVRVMRGEQQCVRFLLHWQEAPKGG